MKKEIQICTGCGSADVIRFGRVYWYDKAAQAYKCKACGKRMSVRLDEVPKKRDISFKPASFSGGVTPPTDWPAYNEAQVQEKLLFLDILQDLCSYVKDNENGCIGRPKASKGEMVFCMAAKCYEGLSSRRVSSDLTIAMQRGHILSVPHFNTLLKYFNDPEMTPILTDLISLSALPLKDLETTFAIDASGLSSAFYSRWLDERLEHHRQHNWIKIHLVCGTVTNIVTAIEVTDGHSNDCPHFPKLAGKTAENFRIKEIFADKGYLSRKNIKAAFDLGAVPYIPFKSNSAPISRGVLAWRRMFYYFKLNPEKFMQRYHLRSNVESTFSALKRKFSTKLMLKNEISQANEALAMVLCYNISILVKEAFESGIVNEFGKFAHLFESLHIKEEVEAECG